MKLASARWDQRILLPNSHGKCAIAAVGSPRLRTQIFRGDTTLTAWKLPRSATWRSPHSQPLPWPESTDGSHQSHRTCRKRNLEVA